MPQAPACSPTEAAVVYGHVKQQLLFGLFHISPEESSTGSVEQKLQAHKDVSAAEVSVQRSAWRLFHVSDGTFNSFCFIPSFSFHHQNVFILFSKTMCFLFCSLALQM